MDLYLFGGGWQPEARPFTYGSFVRAATREGRVLIALVLAPEQQDDAEATLTRYAEAFASVGVSRENLAPLFVSEARPLTFEALAALQPTGVFVGGGLTPLYEAALCRDSAWLEHVRRAELPVGGFSAGAVVMATSALVGGWRLQVAGRSVAVTNDAASEDLELLDIRAGLGLVDFTVDVHATQWGTLSRLVHAVNANLVPRGWAIDEDTLLHVHDGQVSVRGLGSAYFVQRAPDGVHVAVHVATVTVAAV